MLRKYIDKISNNDNLTFEESFEAMNNIISGNVNDILISGFLLSLKTKGESPEEIAGFAQAIKSNAVQFNYDSDNLIDICGTGGDNSGTFNISTATSFVLAGCGVKVAKHGNKSISSLSGSADVLAELGIDIHMSKEKIVKAFENASIAFLFAPDFHPAMKNVANVRRELKTKTVFNILGPLCNPLSPEYQMIGTYNLEIAKKMAEASISLNMNNSIFLNTNNMYDEITLTDKTYLFVNQNNKISEKIISNESFNVDKVNFENLKGSSAKDNAKIIIDILSNNYNRDAINVVLANAAMGLSLINSKFNLKENFLLAKENLENGNALKSLKRLQEI